MFDRFRNASLEQVLLAALGVVVISSGILIAVINDHAYQLGIEQGRTYRDFDAGEFFTLTDESMLSYISVDAVFNQVSYIEYNESFGDLEDRYDPFSELESLLLYSMLMDFNDTYDVDIDFIDIGFYEPKSITVTSVDNRTGHFVVWIWDYLYEEILYVFKFKVTSEHSPVVDITERVVYDNNKKVKPVTIEGIFIPDGSRS